MKERKMTIKVNFVKYTLTGHQLIDIILIGLFAVLAIVHFVVKNYYLSITDVGLCLFWFLDFKREDEINILGQYIAEDQKKIEQLEEELKHYRKEAEQ